MHYIPNNSVQKRVLKHLSKFSNPSECWEWPMSRTKAGYGQLSTSNGSARSVELHYAHRVSYFLSNGPIENGMNICHKCDNPACFNPNHLFCGSQKDNIRDCISKGRFNFNPHRPSGGEHWAVQNKDKVHRALCGENNSRAKLSFDDAKYIRSSGRTGSDLAKHFGVSDSTISAIRRGKTYRSIESLG